MPTPTSTGQTTAQLADQAGATQEEIMRQRKIDTSQNPDVIVGGALDSRLNPEQDFTSSSDEAEGELNDIGAQIDSMSGTPPTTVTPPTDGGTAAPPTLSERSQAAFDQSFDILDTMAKASEGARERSLKNIERKGEISKADMATGQRMEAGATSMKLASIGGYLGDVGSGIAYMNSLGSTHRLETSKLEMMIAESLEKARAAYDQKDIDLANKLMTTATNYQTQLDNQRKLAMDEVKFAQETLTFQRSTDQLTLDAMAASGKAVDDVPDSFFQSIDSASGLRAGTAKGLYKITLDEYNQTSEIDDVAKAKTLSDYLATRPFGEPVKIGDHTYYGTDMGQVEIDENGNGTTFFLDDSGNVVSKDLGYVGKAKDGFEIIKDGAGNPWSVNPQTRESYAMFTSQAGWEEIVPAGSIWDNFGTRTENKGQCGALINDMYTDIHVEDSYDSKLEVTDDAITSKEVREGDIVVSPSGTTGHIASVEEVKYIDGKKMLRLFESNYHNDLKATHNRWIEAESPDLAFGRGTLRPEFISGSDGKGWVTEDEAKRAEKVSAVDAVRYNVPADTTYGEIQDSGLVPKETLLGTEKINLEVKLGNQYDSDVKSYKESTRQAGIIKTSYEEAVEKMDSGESLNAASQGVLVSFQKSLDPDSVVRESEYARSPNGMSLLDRIDGLYTRLKQGGVGVTIEELKNFVDLSERFHQNNLEAQNSFIQRVQYQSDRYGLDVKAIIPEADLDQYNDVQEEDVPEAEATQTDLDYLDTLDL